MGRVGNLGMGIFVGEGWGENLSCVHDYCSSQGGL